ncbi:hypothetical protein NQ318_004066 [Aromia moschata]|uniref:PDZ domain-containing protein n=1 Tax=Aromia moschata TaxID=1265417 RepID=A0AAV8Z887_9CUCU|nr:hypothetical protein NQ318_004066 [Aromia moschata]
MRRLDMVYLSQIYRRMALQKSENNGSDITKFVNTSMKLIYKLCVNGYWFRKLFTELLYLCVFPLKAGIIVGEMILAVNKDSLVGTNHDTATNILRRTEGLVSLVISNPGGKQDTKQEPPSSPKPTTSAAASAAGAESSRGQPATLKPVGPSSRPTTPVPEPVPDPSNCAIVPGRETTIEIATENMVLGTFFVGGKDTATSNGIILVEVYPGGAAAKDGRLQPGDQIMDVNGTSLKDVTYTSALIALRQTLPKMKMTVYRPTNIEYTVIEVDMIRKPGKGLGLSVISRKSGRGVYVSEVLTGGAAEADGKIARGDLLISVNGQDLENSTGEEAGAKLKTATGKVSLKLHRYKITTR